MAATGVALLYGLLQLKFVTWGYRRTFIKWFKFLYPLLFAGKYGVFFWVANDAYLNYDSLTTDMSRVNFLYFFAGAGIDGISILVIFIGGFVIDSKIRKGRDLGVFTVPITKRNYSDEYY
jgi:hypothetical protein